MVTEEIKPWNATLHLLNSTGKAAEVFAGIQRRGRGLAGIIIGGWDREDRLRYYFSEELLPGKQWQEFDDETVVQNPRIFVTLKGALRKMESFSREEIERKTREWFRKRKVTDETRIQAAIRLRIGLRGQPLYIHHIGLISWQHPEAHADPLGEYRDMIGIRLPGCPTQ